MDPFTPGLLGALAKGAILGTMLFIIVVGLGWLFTPLRRRKATKWVRRVTGAQAHAEAIDRKNSRPHYTGKPLWPGKCSCTLPGCENDPFSNGAGVKRDG